MYAKKAVKNASTCWCRENFVKCSRISWILIHGGSQSRWTKMNGQKGPRDDLVARMTAINVVLGHFFLDSSRKITNWCLWGFWRNTYNYVVNKDLETTWWIGRSPPTRPRLDVIFESFFPVKFEKPSNLLLKVFSRLVKTNVWLDKTWGSLVDQDDHHRRLREFFTSVPHSAFKLIAREYMERTD